MGWRAAALGGSQLQLSDVFDAGIVTASLVVLAFGQRSLKRVDWFLAAATGVAMGLLVPSTSFYPLLGWVARSGDAAWVGALDGVGVAATTNPTVRWPAPAQWCCRLEATPRTRRRARLPDGDRSPAPTTRNARAQARPRGRGELTAHREVGGGDGYDQQQKDVKRRRAQVRRPVTNFLHLHLQATLSGLVRGGPSATGASPTTSRPGPDPSGGPRWLQAAAHRESARVLGPAQGRAG